jgi:hypothetical protein
MLNNLLDPDSAVTWPQEWHQKAISEFKRLAAAKTEKVIVSQGELKEIGDYSLVREFKERVNLKVRKGEVWRRALKRNTKYYLLTIFSDYCFLKEAEQDETITVGERQGEKGDHGLLIRNKFFKETLF